MTPDEHRMIRELTVGSVIVNCAFWLVMLLLALILLGGR